MEYLQNGFTLNIAPGTFPLSTDSVLLADFVRLPKNASVLDLGSGCGTLGLLLCAKDPYCRVTGVEIDEAAHRQALDNIRDNDLSARLFSICADLRTIPSLFPAGSFSCCVSNPPYFSGGPASSRTPGTRRNDFCETDELFQAAARALKYGGDFFLVHKPQQLGELCACGGKYMLEAKRLVLVRHRPENEVCMILIQFRKGAKPGLQWEELCLHDAQGRPSEAYCRIYRLPSTTQQEDSL